MDLDLTPWIDRLKSNVDALRGVGGAAELGAVEERTQVTPYAWVMPVAEDAGANIYDNAVSQRITERIGVVIAVRNVRDASGAKAQEDLRLIRRAIKDALIGWLPDPDQWMVVFSRGRLLRFSDRVLWWQDEYTWAYEERKV